LRLSPGLTALDHDRDFIGGLALPVRGYELKVELTYQAQVVPGCTAQRDFQYIFHPGGGTLDPINRLIGRIPDAAVLRYARRSVSKIEASCSKNRPYDIFCDLGPEKAASPARHGSGRLFLGVIAII
jgi:hypothetical protein